jgi:anti-sigma factor RsiW
MVPDQSRKIDGVEKSMNRSPCDQLDDYLLGWLTPDEAAAFERHLADCPACRREQALQRTIDARLEKTCEALDAIPSGLVERTRQRIRAARRRSIWRWTAGLAASAVVVLAMVLAQYRTRDDSRPEGQNLVATTPVEPSDENEQLVISSRVTLTDPSAGIVVEHKTRDPKISIVWIYPAVKPSAPAGGGRINRNLPRNQGEYL